MLIIAIASAWGTREGGINAFNYGLVKGISQLQLGHRLMCVVTSTTENERSDAIACDLALIEVPDENGRPSGSSYHEIQRWLDAYQVDVGNDTVFIGHDVVTGDIAVKIAQVFNCRAALIHHMAYEEYQNLGGGQGRKTGRNFQHQQTLFSTPNVSLFGVGPYLAEHAEQLSGTSATTLIPGFPEFFTSNSANSDQLRIVIAGRFTDETETLKQAKLAVEALGTAMKQTSGHVPRLQSPVMFILGVDGGRVDGAELEQLANSIAERQVKIVPIPFSDDPQATMNLMRQANLAIMPSFHEGFGLVGWEAIGCDVPLIFGTESGIYKFVRRQLAEFRLHGIHFQGGAKRPDDVQKVAEAIVSIAKDLSAERIHAERLREQLKVERGCTWRGTAEEFISGLSLLQQKGSALPKTTLKATGRILSSSFVVENTNFHDHCAELSLTPSQGSRSERFDVLAELRFGRQHVAIDDFTVEVSLKRAFVEVTSRTGRIPPGPRLGDSPAIAGLQPRSGGVWEISDPAGGMQMVHYALGTDALCQIVTPPNVAGHVKVDVLALHKDVNCDFGLPDEEATRLNTKVMKIFVQKALLEDTSGRIVVSTAEMEEVWHDD